MARGVDVVGRDRREGEPACYVDAEHLYGEGVGRGGGMRGIKNEG